MNGREYCSGNQEGPGSFRLPSRHLSMRLAFRKTDISSKTTLDLRLFVEHQWSQKRAFSAEFIVAIDDLCWVKSSVLFDYVWIYRK